MSIIYLFTEKMLSAMRPAVLAAFQFPISTKPERRDALLQKVIAMLKKEEK